MMFNRLDQARSLTSNQVKIPKATIGAIDRALDDTVVEPKLVAPKAAFPLD